MFIQLSKRGQISQRRSLLIKVSSLLVAFIIVGIYLSVLGYSPFKVYGALLQGAFGGTYNLGETIVKAIPILIGALGLGIAFRMNFWNIGAEGQMLLGGFGAAYVAFNMGQMPKPALLMIMGLIGGLCGAMWALIPGLFKVKWQTNETIVTLMMNYVALKWITYLQYVAWKDPKAMGFPKIASFEKSAQLPSLFGIHMGWLVALLLVGGVYFYMNFSKKGYEAAVIGESMETARYAAIPIKRSMLFSIGLSGFLCGIAGMIQASGVSKTLSTSITGGAGNIAIIVAWMSGLNPLTMVMVSFLFAGLLQGGAYIQVAAQIPSALADLIEGVVLFAILGSEFFIHYKLKWIKTTEEVR